MNIDIFLLDTVEITPVRGTFMRSGERRGENNGEKREQINNEHKILLGWGQMQ